jgi:hypothetical protein
MGAFQSSADSAVGQHLDGEEGKLRVDEEEHVGGVGSHVHEDIAQDVHL